MRIRAFATLALLGAAFLPVSARGAQPEIVEVSVFSNVGKAIANMGYYADREQDPKNPLCFTFTNMDKPTTVSVEGAWYSVDSGKEIGTAELATRVLKKGEKERLCLKPPKNAKGRIRFEGFYSVDY